MKTRDYFAAMAMQAIISKAPFMVSEVEDKQEYMESFMHLVANGAYAYADAMMKKRNTEE